MKTRSPFYPFQSFILFYSIIKIGNLWLTFLLELKNILARFNAKSVTDITGVSS